MPAILFACRSALVLATALGALCAPVPAMAQNPAYMNCSDLWYSRNEIYARNGYCFNTDRAKAVFGAGCFPPYGKLSGNDQAMVSDIQSWERRKGC